MLDVLSRVEPELRNRNLLGGYDGATDGDVDAVGRWVVVGLDVIDGAADGEADTLGRWVVVGLGVVDGAPVGSSAARFLELDLPLPGPFLTFAPLPVFSALALSPLSLLSFLPIFVVPSLFRSSRACEAVESIWRSCDAGSSLVDS